MSNKIDDGGPAFPVAIMARQADGQPMTGCDFGVGGMTLRAYLAWQALTGELANSLECVWKTESADVVASRCVAFADALIKRLNEVPT